MAVSRSGSDTRDRRAPRPPSDDTAAPVMSQGFVLAKWAGTAEDEEKLKDLNVTIRCLPYSQSGSEGTCILTGKPTTADAILAKAY